MTEAEPDLPKHSLSYGQYFQAIKDEISTIYQMAESARARGFDPQTKVEVPPAHDVAARVEATLDGPAGLAKRIRELQKEKESREAVAFAVAEEIARGVLGGIHDQEKAADKAVRVALSILTESITAAPLEGIAKVCIRGSGDERYLALYLAGPIRAAGGTEAAVTVLVADHVRQVLGIPPLKSTEEEVERALEEVELYARNVHLQYPVNPDLIRHAAKNLPIMLTGEPTEEFEVTGTRDLERIETNRVRGGAVLVLSDGVVGRAAKLLRIIKSGQVVLPGWEDWLGEIAKKSSKAKPDEAAAKSLAPKDDYLVDIIGGRPVFSHPSRLGGFRLRYGRSRNTGLAAVGIHPATMFVVEEFLAPGTHIRTERPGKGSIVAPVDTIEGPVVLFKDGSVRQISSIEEARRSTGVIQKILYLGDILVALGEFLENNHPLVPSAYCEEWWSHDLATRSDSMSAPELKRNLERAGVTEDEFELLTNSPLTKIPAPEQSLAISRLFGIPLHPRYTIRWGALTHDQFLELRQWILKQKSIEETSEGSLIVLPVEPRLKEMLERIGASHRYSESPRHLVLLDSPVTILAQLGNPRNKPSGSTALEAVNSVSDVKIGNRLGFFIGARMGRPEKAEERKMKPPIQALFPVGRETGTERGLEKLAMASEVVTPLDKYLVEGQETPTAQGRKGVLVELVNRNCPNCKRENGKPFETFESRCPQCNEHTNVQRWCSQEGCGLNVDADAETCPRGHDPNMIRSTREVRVDIQAQLEKVKEEISESSAYDVRGVLGLTNEMKIPEYLGKGILRAKHGVYCYRDGTARFDATDAPLTHFTPREVGVSIDRLHKLGYLADYEGTPLVSDDQILELKVQDLVVPERCADYLVRVGRFVDDCLEKIYDCKRYYNFTVLEDVVGQLVIGLAPHTSAGIVGRVVGLTDASVCYAHPYWHAAKRRNCDGDEDSLILVLDALLNFSKSYLPAGRGGFMDAPLVLSVILNPKEVDDESHNMEVCSRYPARFYEATSKVAKAKDFEKLVDTVANRLGEEAQYEGFSFTHGTSSIHLGPRTSRYKTLGSMVEKVEAQLRLAGLLAAVDAPDVAERVLSHHFIRDIRGNMRAYSTQKIQCMKCRRKYRRVPLSGRCVCGSVLTLTVRKKNISKYLSIGEHLIADYNLGSYLRERLRLITSALDSMFVSEQMVLTDFESE